MFMDDPLFKALFDGHDIYELVDKLIEADIMTKENLLERYWDEIEENEEEISPFSEE